MKKLTPPESQIQEVLFNLINRLHIDRRSMMLSCNVWNLPDNIMKLRRKGLNITSTEKTSKNKYGREIKFVHYSLQNKKEASIVYAEMKAAKPE